MLKFELDTDNVKIEVPGNALLPSLSYAIHCGICWFLGHGIYMYSIQRFLGGGRHGESDGCKVIMQAESPAKAFAFSPVTSLKSLLADNYLPQNLKDHEKYSVDNVVKAADGQNRVGHMSLDEQAIIQNININTGLLMSMWAFKQSDETLNFFCCGATKVEWRISKSLEQVRFNRVTVDNLIKCVTSDQCYNPDHTVGSFVY